MSYSHLTKRAFEALEAKKLEDFMALFAEDSRHRFASDPPTIGKEAIRAYMTRAIELFEQISHDVVNTWEGEDTITVEADVTYTLPNNRQVFLPAVTIIQVTNNLITDYRLYMDASPLFAAMNSGVTTFK